MQSSDDSHYFSFSALDYFWENTHQMAQSFTQATSFASPISPPSTGKKTTKPPLSPRGAQSFDGRPPLSPTSVTHDVGAESVETILSPRSIDDVRLFVVRELDDIPDLYDYPSPKQQQQRQQPSDIHSLDYTQDSRSASGQFSEQSEVDAPFDEYSMSATSCSSASGELLGLRLLDRVDSEEPPSFPTLVRLDLGYFQHDPPKAHYARRPRQVYL